ncbi:MAG: phosphate acyltransferase [Akkermansiaceae bacterium]
MPSDFIFQEANNFTAKLYATLKLNPKRIVFADGEDIRVIRVAARMVELEIGVPILIGDRDKITAMAAKEDISMQFVSIVNPAKSSDLKLFCERIHKVSRFQNRVIDDAEELMSRPHNYAAMMVQYGHADGLVAGNLSLPSAVFRATMTMMKPLKHVPKVFGAMVMVAPHLPNFGHEGILFLADCGVIPDPDVQELAAIAVETGRLAYHFLGRPPRIALLSHSTAGSSSAPSAKKMQAVKELARMQAVNSGIDMIIDGEIQADVALVAEASEIKKPNSKPKNSADVLVFPNLDAGNIALKLLQHVGGAQNYGQLIIGIARPAAQVPRTVTEETLLGTAAIVGNEAIKFNELYMETK